MKVTELNETSKYPKLMRGKVSKSIYLMTEFGMGMKLKQGGNGIGDGSKPLKEVKTLGMDSLEDFNGELTLSN